MPSQWHGPDDIPLGYGETSLQIGPHRALGPLMPGLDEVTVSLPDVPYKSQ